MSFFSTKELQMHRLFMAMAFEVVLWYCKLRDVEKIDENLFANINVTVVVDPSIKSVVAVAIDNSIEHPVQHASMIAIDNVAKTQYGGAWKAKESKGFDTNCSLDGIDKDMPRHKTCFLRPDTGPCRADIIQWYFDVKQSRCYRFFWGGCQGNGNRFDSAAQCENFCVLNTTHQQSHIPFFCSIAFDFGNCFGHYNRWSWDRFTKSCKRRIYSGCGGNQNNFETKQECINTCLKSPNNTVQRFQQFTTCIPFQIEELY